jgi:hypothetical protein
MNYVNNSKSCILKTIITELQLGSQSLKNFVFCLCFLQEDDSVM